MFVQKNLPMWERALRICVGLLVAAAAFYLPLEPLLMWVMAAGGIMFICTGFIGFCPMCAVAGRKLSRQG